MLPEKAEEVRAWLKKASDDIRGAEIDLAAKPPFIEDALFHCQQAVEKSLKGFLTAHDRVFKKTHDLDELAIACEGIEPSFKESLKTARHLTVFAWEFRYPGPAEVPPLDEVLESLQVARRVFSAVLQSLPDSVRP